MPNAYRNSNAQKSETIPSRKRLRVFVMDLWCFVPFYCASLVQALRNTGVDVTLGSISDQRDLSYFANEGIKNDPGILDLVSRLRIRGQGQRQVLKLAEACLNMFALAVRFLFRRPDILHVQYIPLLERGVSLETWFLRYAQRLGIRIVYTVHNILPHDSGDHHRALYSRVYRQMDALICHRHETKIQLEQQFGITSQSIWTIPHGLLFSEGSRPSREDARTRLGIATSCVVVLWQGIVKPYKGIPFLLESWRKVEQTCPMARLIIAGSGDAAALDRVRQITDELKLQNSVQLELRFLSSDEVMLFHQASDILVYPYESITQSGALFTGISFGKAIVATSLPAFQEVLIPSGRGVLVSYGDSHELASSLSTLISDASERNRLANAGAEWLHGRYSWQGIASQTVACYETVLKDAR